ncbi:TPA: hypothetical protein L6A34_31460 [Pseudomonas aeruginosa]|uniref:hypothetical protein n=1 Tax=Pseudomonas aeruginosa TaxID=287 RepID=UPI000710AF0C|nr:hypothetical protein [Pseudomonas aeruginosa]ELQ8317596.1 hypothetical protein [Pseudomonas aeruginosa]KSM65127.1 hypothetical protein APA70_22295 [Pseudomonas aeruginosa]HBP5961602.1 hypothetical protein [Pseudomonas aeruginosa]HBP6298963.1 hypothetical protein [Pseudomonas aeruginosa]HBP6386437.1 hypothetical protein [Pseudomonas aeruginosa]
MPTEKTPDSLTDLLVSLMPAGDDRSMWRDGMASVLEQVAATDDLSLLRAAKGADEFEVSFMEFVSNFPGVEVVPAPEGGFYGFMLGLVKLDRDARGEVLRALAAELRKS